MRILCLLFLSLSIIFSSACKINLFTSNKKKNKNQPSEQKDAFKSKREKRKLKTADAFTRKSETAEYGEKAFGKKPKKRFERNQRKSKNVGDAFTVHAEQNNDSPYNISKDRKPKKTWKKRKWFKFKSKEEKMREKQENNPQNSNQRFVKREIEKQKKKREYGLGLP